MEKAPNEDAIFESHKGLVFFVVNKYRNRPDFPDILSEGYIGLLQAVRRNDGRPEGFGGLAVVCIRGSISRYFHNKRNQNTDVSLNAPFRLDESDPLQDRLEDPSARFEESLLDRLEGERILSLIPKAADRSLIRKRFEGATLEALGVTRGLTKQRMQQRQAKILDRLRTRREVMG